MFSEALEDFFKKFRIWGLTVGEGFRILALLVATRGGETARRDFLKTGVDSRKPKPYADKPDTGRGSLKTGSRR